MIFHLLSLFLLFSLVVFSSAQNWSVDLNRKQQTIQDQSNSSATSISPPQESPQPGTRLQIHLPGEPAHLNPISSNDIYAKMILSLIHDTLLVPQVDGTFEPSLCSSYEVEDLVILKRQGTTQYLSDKLFGHMTPSEGGFTLKPRSQKNPTPRETFIPEEEIFRRVRNAVFTFYLKEGFFWHDGTPFQAKDIKFSYQRLKQAQVDSDALRYSYDALKYCEVITPNQIRFIFEQENILALPLLAQFPIVPQHLYFDPQKTEEDQAKVFNQSTPENKNFIGLGPYRIQNWIPGDRIELIRNPQYPIRTQSGYLETISIRFLSDPEKVEDAFQSGQLDFLFHLDPEQILLKNFSPTTVQGTYVLDGFQGIGWNLSHLAFQDRRVRQAMAHFFSREAFIEKYLYHYAQHQSSPGFTPETAVSLSVPHDPQKAQELLGMAGWRDRDQDGVLDFHGRRFEFEMLYPEGNLLAQQLSHYYADILKPYGILLHPKPLLWVRFNTRLQLREF
ncbi:MAG: ABC transporter substrate-binding protein, partial [Planctomycetota bacterium]